MHYYSQRGIHLSRPIDVSADAMETSLRTISESPLRHADRTIRCPITHDVSIAVTILNLSRIGAIETSYMNLSQIVQHE